MSIDKFTEPENHPDDTGSGEQDRLITISALSQQDVPGLRPILESAVVNPITKEVVEDEVEDLLTKYEDIACNGGKEQYFVAHNSKNQPVGIMGLKPPDDVMKKFAVTENPAEIVNAYILKSSRGLGVGSHLVHHIEMMAKLGGHSEIVVNSGPRYMFSGWPFWRKMYGEPVGVAEKYYDKEWDAQVWRKIL